MRRTKLQKIGLIALMAGAVLLLVRATLPFVSVDQLSLDLTVRTLYQGKSITGSGELFYRVKGGLMVTKLEQPLKQIVFSNALGEYKSYDMASNTVTLSQGSDFSSKNSFIYSFLSGETNDMGLGRLGYKLSDTRFEEKMVIKKWEAPENHVGSAKYVEIAFENYLPIYVGFMKYDGEIVQKTYYTNYQTVSFIKMPLTITEVQFISPEDSTITQRKYSNLKVNGDVNEQWLNYTIPSNAKVITPEDLKPKE